MHKVFGNRENIKYFDRPGAYLIPVKDNKIAIVQLPKGLFLLGGKIEDGETELQCITRECLEEIGFTVSISEKIGSAEAFSTHSTLGPFHPIQYYYVGNLVKKVKKPIEQNHTLLWVSYSEIKGKMFSPMQNWAIDLAAENGIIKA